MSQDELSDYSWSTLQIATCIFWLLKLEGFRPLHLFRSTATLKMTSCTHSSLWTVLIWSLTILINLKDCHKPKHVINLKLSPLNIVIQQAQIPDHQTEILKLGRVLPGVNRLSKDVKVSFCPPTKIANKKQVQVHKAP